MLEACDNCLFFLRNECHLHPPVRLPRKFEKEASASSRIRNEEIIWGWPKTRYDEWCGRYKVSPAFQEGK
jgi:hypothetical protein